MKIRLKLTIILLTVLFFSSCEEKGISKNNVNTTIVVDLNKSKKKGYSDLLKTTDYILLKPDNNQYIVYPEKIIKYDDKLYISTRDYKIFIYNLKGDILNVIDSPGEGPGGIRKIDDFQITGNQIIVKDGYLKKLLYYNLNGDLVKEEKDLFSTSNFYIGNDFKLFYPHNDPEFGEFRIIKVNKDNSINRFIEKGDYLNPRVYVQNGFQKVPESENIFIGLPVTFEVVYFDNKGELFHKINLDLGKNQVSPKERARFSNIQEEYMFLNSNKYIDSFTRIFPISNKNFMFVVNRGEKYPNVVICNINGDLIFNSEAFLDYTNNLKNITIPWTYSEGKMISWNRMNVLYEDYNSNYSGNDSTKLKGFFDNNSDYLDQEDIVIILSELKNQFL